MPATGSDPEVAAGFDDEVATVGGGPAGCSAVRRCAREGRDTVGCESVPGLVGSVERTDDGDGFIVEPQDEAVEAYVTEYGFVKARESR